MVRSDFDIAWDYLGAEGWPRVVARQDRHIHTLFVAGTTQYDCHLHVLADRRQLLFYSVYPTHAPRGRIPALLELVARANWDLVWGTLEAHADHGGVRFRTSLTLGAAPLDAELLRPLTLGNTAALFRLHPCLDAVIAGASATEAITLAS